MIDTKVDLEGEVRSVQNLLYENLPKKTNVKIPRRKLQGVWLEIIDTPLTKIKDCFGDFGVYLKKFLEYFNLSHPGAQPVVDLLDNQHFSKLISKALFAYESALEHQTPGILALLHNSLNDNKITENLSFMNTSPPLRAIADPVLRSKLRKQCRLSKCSGSVGFTEFELEGKNWYDAPDSISHYIRMNDLHVSETNFTHYKKVIRLFVEYGMDSQATVYKRHLDNYEGREQYCGFQRVDVGSMLTTLGKVHGFISEKNCVFLSPDRNCNLVKFLLKTICLSPKSLAEIMKWISEDWLVPDPTTFMEALDCTNHSHEWLSIFKLVFKNNPMFFYRSRVYMVSNPIVSKLVDFDMQSIIDQLERFHDYGGLPLFDHFLLLVPSIHLSELFYNDKNSGYFIKDNENIRVFETKEDVSVFLDFLMIKNRMVVPLLIGQKDDGQYPIGYCSMSRFFRPPTLM